MNANRKAFLDMIAISEGTSTHKATKNEGYDVIVTGVNGKPEIFTDYSDHPFSRGRKSKVINSRGLTSNAAGRYQIMLRDWVHYRRLLDLDNKKIYPGGAFSPPAQDAYAMQLICERGALPLIDRGKFKDAVARCANIWASLPGNNYGQHQNKLADLQMAYVNAGGVLA